MTQAQDSPSPSPSTDFAARAENLAAGTGDYGIAAAVKSWTNEVCE